MLETYLKLIPIEIFKIDRIINEKHVSAKSCMHCHCLIFQLVVAYAEKQSKAKDIDFDLPLHCSSLSKSTNGSSLDTVMW
jgi:hypothetical protein